LLPLYFPFEPKDFGDHISVAVDRQSSAAGKRDLTGVRMHFLKKRLRLVIAGVALAIVGVLGVSHTAFATTWTTSELSSEAGVLSGYCMNNTLGSSTNGNAQELWTCSGGNYLGYAPVSSSYGDGNWLEIQIEGTGKCLSGQGGDDGTAVVEYQCNGSANQAICWTDNPSGVATVWRFEDGEAIGDKNDVASNGNPIIVWSVNGSNSESWTGPWPPTGLSPSSKCDVV
jgi:hypothetical protein